MTLTHSRLALLAGLACVLVLGGATLSYLRFRGGAAQDEDDTRRAAAPQQVSQVNGETHITLDAPAQRAAGIRTQPLAPAAWGATLRAYGTVLDAQPLADLASRHATARAQLQAAQARLDAARLGLARARTLYADQQNMSAAQLQAAQSAYRTEQAGLLAAQSEVRVVELEARQGWGEVLGASLLAGTAPAADVIARRVLLIQVTLRPGEHAAGMGDAVLLKEDGTRIALTYLSAATHTDPRIQGESLLFTAGVDAGLLPGMSVVALLPGAGSRTGLLVPAGAVVWMDGAAWAYFKTAADRFVRRRVPLAGARQEGYVVQASRGGEVVVQGAQALLFQEERGEARVSD